jgi:2-dehydro-3-deoxyphosphogluconate aldolase/(4S)-4-hydroxy-2-oxoglutarate aldolase
MPYLSLMPTGGVDLTNIASYFQAGAQAVGVGSSLVKPSAVAQANWSAISHAASQYTQAIHS